MAYTKNEEDRMAAALGGYPREGAGTPTSTRAELAQTRSAGHGSSSSVKRAAGKAASVALNLTDLTVPSLNQRWAEQRVFGGAPSWVGNVISNTADLAVGMVKEYSGFNDWLAGISSGLRHIVTGESGKLSTSILSNPLNRNPNNPVYWASKTGLLDNWVDALPADWQAKVKDVGQVYADVAHASEALAAGIGSVVYGGQAALGLAAKTWPAWTAALGAWFGSKTNKEGAQNAVYQAVTDYEARKNNEPEPKPEPDPEPEPSTTETAERDDFTPVSSDKYWAEYWAKQAEEERNRSTLIQEQTSSILADLTKSMLGQATGGAVRSVMSRSGDDSRWAMGGGAPFKLSDAIERRNKRKRTKRSRSTDLSGASSQEMASRRR